MDVSTDGETLIKRWLGAIEEKQKASSALNRADCELSNSRADLAKWMLPADARPGEKIAVWYGDSLIQVEAPETINSDPIVTIRNRGRSIRRA